MCNINFLNHIEVTVVNNSCSAFSVHFCKSLFTMTIVYFFISLLDVKAQYIIFQNIFLLTLNAQKYIKFKLVLLKLIIFSVNFEQFKN